MDVFSDKSDFDPAYECLDGAVRNAVQDIIRALRMGIVVGNHVPRKQIPRYYIRRHGIQTLYRVNLPLHWRLVYTIHTFTKGQKPQVLLLEIMDHNHYNKRFGYFKKTSH